MQHRVVVLLAALTLVACESPTQPDLSTRPPQKPSATKKLTAQDILSRYVALGTSNSMGVQSAGIFAGGQKAAWPAQLAARVAVAFSLPLVADPGCGPPLAPPLAADLVLVGAFGNDLVTTVMNTCAPLQAGVTLPTNNVAISGADVHDALYSTPESEAAVSSRKGALYSRVLAPGQTQVSAMLSESPTFVSVELAANDVWTGMPVSLVNAFPISVTASVREAAAKTVAPGPCAAAGKGSNRVNKRVGAPRTRRRLVDKKTLPA